MLSLVKYVLLISSIIRISMSIYFELLFFNFDIFLLYLQILDLTPVIFVIRGQVSVPKSLDQNGFKPFVVRLFIETKSKYFLHKWQKDNTLLITTQNFWRKHILHKFDRYKDFFVGQVGIMV